MMPPLMVYSQRSLDSAKAGLKALRYTGMDRTANASSVLYRLYRDTPSGRRTVQLIAVTGDPNFDGDLLVAILAKIGGRPDAPAT